MTTRDPAQCASCAHWIPGIRNNGIQTCAAFPDRIPDEIWWNRVDHREPVDGDHGVQWESKDGGAYPEWVLAEPALDQIHAMAAEDDDMERAAGHDVTPGHDELHHYWLTEGLPKWADSPRPWTTLVALLTRHVGLRKAKIFASRWFIEHFGFAAGSDKNRVAHGQPPRGHRVGPG